MTFAGWSPSLRRYFDNFATDLEYSRRGKKISTAYGYGISHGEIERWEAVYGTFFPRVGVDHRLPPAPAPAPEPARAAPKFTSKLGTEPAGVLELPPEASVASAAAAALAFAPGAILGVSGDRLRGIFLGEEEVQEYLEGALEGTGVVWRSLYAPGISAKEARPPSIAPALDELSDWAVRNPDTDTDHVWFYPEVGAVRAIIDTFYQSTEAYGSFVSLERVEFFKLGDGQRVALFVVNVDGL